MRLRWGRILIAAVLGEIAARALGGSRPGRASEGQSGEASRHTWRRLRLLVSTSMEVVPDRAY
jgi:hypothetical protein